RRLCGPGRSRAPAPSLQSGGDRLLSRLERVAQPVRVLAAGLGKRRPPAAAAPDVATELADELHGVEPSPDQRVVEVHDEVGAPAADGADDHAGGVLLPAHAVRQVAERAALRSFRLDENDVALPLDDREVRLRRLLRLARLLACVLELAPQVLRLVAC